MLGNYGHIKLAVRCESTGKTNILVLIVICNWLSSDKNLLFNAIEKQKSLAWSYFVKIQRIYSCYVERRPVH